MQLFRKALRLPIAARAANGVGTITNLTANDADRLSQLSFGLNYLWTAPIQVGSAAACNDLHIHVQEDCSCMIQPSAMYAEVDSKAWLVT